MVKQFEAINVLLTTIGETALTESDSLDFQNGLFYEATIASDLIDEITTELLSEGWRCNTETNYPLVPAVTATSGDNKYISIGDNIIRADEVNGEDYVIKDNKIYDKENHTFVFEDTKYFNLVLDMDFDDIPYSMQRYITMRASRIFAQRMIGDATMVQYSVQDEFNAKMRMIDEESIEGDYNIFDSYDVNRTIIRSRNPRAIGN